MRKACQCLCSMRMVVTTHRGATSAGAAGAAAPLGVFLLVAFAFPLPFLVAAAFAGVEFVAVPSLVGFRLATRLLLSADFTSDPGCRPYFCTNASTFLRTQVLTNILKYIRICVRTYVYLTRAHLTRAGLVLILADGREIEMSWRQSSCFRELMRAFEATISAGRGRLQGLGQPQ